MKGKSRTRSTVGSGRVGFGWVDLVDPLLADLSCHALDTRNINYSELGRNTGKPLLLARLVEIKGGGGVRVGKEGNERLHWPMGFGLPANRSAEPN